MFIWTFVPDGTNRYPLSWSFASSFSEEFAFFNCLDFRKQEKSKSAAFHFRASEDFACEFTKYQ